MDFSVKRYANFYLLLYVAAFVLLVYFSFFFQWDFSTPDELRREINGPFRKWINGYLSLLTNTKYSGPFCLLIIPSWIYLFNRKRLEASLFFVAAVFLIGIKGYINYRYAYTLFPLMLFVTGYVFVEKNNMNLQWRYVISLALIFLHTLFFIGFELYPKYSRRLQLPATPSGKDVFRHISTHKDFQGKVFLVNNLPEFYYHCKNKGYYYWCKEDELYTAEGKKVLFNNRESLTLLKQMNVHYILSDTIFGKDNMGFASFLDTHATTIYTDSRGRIIYKVRY
jgi:hypothetical protein